MTKLNKKRIAATTNNRQRIGDSKQVKNRIITSGTIDYFPRFSFKYFSNHDYGFDCEDSEFKELVKRINLLENKTWIEIQNSNKHQIGYEKIPINSVRKKLPESIKDFYTGNNYSVFRYKGNNAPMVGVIFDNTFYVLFIDPDFTLYKHS